MSVTYIAVATGLGGFVAGVALLGVCCSVIAGHPPGHFWVGMVAIGLIVFTIALVSRFEEQSRARSRMIPQHSRMRQQARLDLQDSF